MRKLKSILSTFCALVILLGSTFQVNASEAEMPKINISTHTYTEYTPIEFYAHYKEITGEEYTDKIPETRGSITQKYITVSEPAGNGMYIEVGCLVNMGCGQSCSWNSIVPGTTYSASYGQTFSSWDPVSSYAVMSADRSKISFSARGTIKVETTHSASTGFSAAGFSVSVGASGVYTCSKMLSVYAVAVQ